MAEPSSPRWYRDPVVWLGVVAGVAASAGVFFAGRYLPYDDWAGHVGLSSVLAHGDDTGADAYLARSLTPTPYFSFYVATAAGAHVVGAEVAAKLNLLVATALWVIGAARLAEATGRSPRLALVAPLGLFGASLGMGFSSFVFGAPWLLFVLADLERLLARSEAGERLRRPASKLALGLALAFLGHGLVFVFAALLVAVRGAAQALRRRGHRPEVLRAAGAVALAFSPSVLLAVPSLIRRAERPYVSPEFASPEGPSLASFASPKTHLDTLAGDLLDRGGEGHGVTAALAGAVLVAWLVAWAVRRRPGAGAPGPYLYAATMTLLFAFGPVHAGWPVTFWVVYQRAGSIALVLLFLLPRAALAGRRGAALACLALVPVLHNAAVNAEVVSRFSKWAAPFDEVRAAIPPHQRIQFLNAGGVPFGRAVGSLPFLLFVDGARYLPVGHIPEEMPVHRLNAPGTPYNFSVGDFSPEAAAQHYDYLVLRGGAVVGPTRRSPRFEEVVEAGGWVVFRRAEAP